MDVAATEAGDDTGASVARSRLLGQRGGYPEAIEAAKHATQVRPSDFWVRSWLAEVYRLTGHPELAEPEEVARDLLAPKLPE